MAVGATELAKKRLKLHVMFRASFCAIVCVHSCSDKCLVYNTDVSDCVNIYGERINVRDWRADEIDGMHRWLSDPEVNKFLSFGTRTISESGAHLQDVIASQREKPRQHYYLAIELKELGITIGDAGFSWNEEGIAEIGYFLEPTYWGKGYATEAANMMISFALDAGAHTVLASCDINNRDSEKVMRRCGMKGLESHDSGRLLYGITQDRRGET